MEGACVEEAPSQPQRKDETMDNSPLNQVASSAIKQAPSAPPASPSRARFVLLGFFLGCIPLGIPVVCLLCNIPLYTWNWETVSLSLYGLAWVVAAFLLKVIPAQSSHSLAKGLMVGLGVTAGLVLCFYAYLLITFALGLDNGAMMN
jgi:hypothetical protein